MFASQVSLSVLLRQTHLQDVSMRQVIAIVLLIVQEEKMNLTVWKRSARRISLDVTTASASLKVSISHW